LVLFEEFKKLYKDKTGEYLFTNPKTGKPYNCIRKAWMAVKRHTKIPPEFRFHDLRHHIALKLMDNNVNVAAIRELLGHLSLAATQKHARIEDNAKNGD